LEPLFLAKRSRMATLFVSEKSLIARCSPLLSSAVFREERSRVQKCGLEGEKSFRTTAARADRRADRGIWLLARAFRCIRDSESRNFNGFILISLVARAPAREGARW
jgi:hypothetical protein